MSTATARRARSAVLVGALAVASLAPAPPAGAALVGEPEVVAAGLELPWEIAFTPDGRALVTERPGRVRVIGAGGGLRAAPAYADRSASKFLGLALHPSYACNRLVYLYLSRGPGPGNSVIRLLDDGTNLVNPVTIFDGIASDGSHDGGRIAFGPDGKLYVTTGDVHDPTTPQNLDSLNGKILRLEAPGGAGDGAAPADNPFNSPGETRARRFVWSYGHRHPQGLAWDSSGRLWQTEHGPTGEAHAAGRRFRDEVNRIDRGANYGWPIIMGSERRDGMRSPVATSGDSVTWAPGGAAFGPDGLLYAPELAGEGLLEMSVAGDEVTALRELFPGSYGRMRTAVATRTHLYLTTSNNTSDEKVLRVAFDRPGVGAPPTACPPGTAVAFAPRTKRTQRIVAARSTRAALGRLLARARVRLRRDGLHGLERRGRLTVRADGLRAGRVSLRLGGRRPHRGALTLAAGSRRIDGPTTRVSSRLTRRGRSALRDARAMRIRVRAAFRGREGRRFARAVTLAVRR